MGSGQGQPTWATPLPSKRVHQYYKRQIGGYKRVCLYTRHSVEKSSKMLSRILRKNELFFRQINTKMNHLPIYLVKPPWENANSNFLRKFAQV